MAEAKTIVLEKRARGDQIMPVYVTISWADRNIADNSLSRNKHAIFLQLAN